MTKREYFNKEFLPHYRMMYGVALRLLRNEDDASDAVQSCICRIWQSVRDGSEVDNAEAFCRASIRRHCLNELRDRRPEDDPESLAEWPERDEANEGETFDEMLSMLDSRQREAMRLRIVGEYRCEEIAEVMSLSSANVRQLLSRARQKLLLKIKSNEL